MPEPAPPDPFPPFGPFLADCSPLEKAYLLGLLAGMSYTLCGSANPAAEALHRARSFRLDDLAVALAELARLPPVQKRRVMGSYMGRTSGPRVIVNGKKKEKAA